MKYENKGRIVDYPKWLANIVSVPKGRESKNMCDYIDLNIASPKDYFSLSHNDVLVEYTADHVIFSFMDGFSEYNRIHIVPKDREKTSTSFITLGKPSATKSCAQSKNVGATYQRTMTAHFHDVMHKGMKIYVVDMIPKSITKEDHPVV